TKIASASWAAARMDSAVSPSTSTTPAPIASRCSFSSGRSGMERPLRRTTLNLCDSDVIAFASPRRSMKVGRDAPLAAERDDVVVDGGLEGDPLGPAPLELAVLDLPGAVHPIEPRGGL